MASLAGGTDLIPLMKYGVKKPAALMNLDKVPEMRGIEVAGNDLSIGAMTTLTDLSNDEKINRSFPAVGRSARAVASPQICRAALISVLRDDARCALSPDGRWRIVPERDPLEQPLNAASFTVMAAAIFIWPQWGVHRLMQTEKEKALHEVDLRFEAVLAKFNQLVDGGNYADAVTLNGTIASLEIQYRRLSAIPTWPWRPEVARVALTAIASPLILMVIQYFVFQALGR